MAVHVIMFPALKSSSWVIGVLAINLDELVEDPTGEV
jgi:hypothetical protein